MWHRDTVACMAAYLLNITPTCALNMEVLQQKYLNIQISLYAISNIICSEVLELQADLQ